jgi:Predicted membrane protein (DUF2157)
MALMLLVLIGIIVGIVMAVRHERDVGPSSPAASRPAKDSARASITTQRDLSRMLDAWVVDGLISAEQARAILDRERPAAPAVAPVTAGRSRPRRVPVYAEALGYLGGVLALVGLTLLVANYWPDLATAARLTLALATTAVLVTAGIFIPEQRDPALARLRWFLWTLSSATAALFTGVLAVDGFEVGTDVFVVAACAGTVAMLNLALWQFRDRPVQEFLAFVGVIVTAGTLMAGVVSDGVAGVTVWLLGAATLALGIGGLTRRPILPHVVGAVAMLAGSLMTVSENQGGGLLFVTGTAAVLALLAALPQVTLGVSKRVVLLVVAGVGALQGIPPMLVYFARDGGLATGLATWMVGAVLMTVGARRLLRAPMVAELLGGLALIGGAAITAAQWPSFAPLFGLATALGLLVIGMLPGRVLYSLLGSVGLLVNVPWTIARFFPGEGRAPLLILVSGAVIIVVAVLLARQSGRLRTELRSTSSDAAEDRTLHHV